MEKPFFSPDHEQTLLYEVIRVIDAIPIFLENHLDRLYLSARLTGLEQLPEPDALTRMIKTYITSQKKDTGNIKLSFRFNHATSKPQCDLNFIPHYYPSNEEYTHGVKVGLIDAVRPIPHAKVHHSDIRDRANKAIADNNLYEVLLIDSDGNITEGSRSNVFFIKNEMLYTAPDDKILQGITWNKVMLMCKEAGIQVIEGDIPANKPDHFDGAFLSGTSPKILPISSIEKFVYKTDLPLLIKLQNSYNQLIENYLRERT